MPDFNAHTYYGKKCLEYLGPRAKALTTDQAAFQLGLYGPDPLKFTGTAYLQVKEYHIYWRDETLPLLTEAIQGQDPTARSYAVGCLLHFLLDEKLHPSIRTWKKAGSSHYRLELALDALVLRKQKITLMPRILVRHRSSIHHVFPGLKPAAYRMGLRVMAKVVDGFRWRGESLYKKVTPTEWEQARQLLNLLEDCVPDGAKALEELLPAQKTAE